jgi:hypothetical protein
MKIGKQDKLLLFEQEFLALVFMIILGFVFYLFKLSTMLYILTLLIGFVIYFWMLVEENIHKTGKKHSYFEHTSSFVMLGQTALALGLLSLHFNIDFLIIIFLVISVIMYSVSLSRIILYKWVFKD